MDEEKAAQLGLDVTTIGNAVRNAFGGAYASYNNYPTGADFPGGETMHGMQARMVQEINMLVGKHPGQTIAVIGHADLIKAAVAHYLGVHFDLFQRIVISTASITAINFNPMGPRILTVNDTNHNPPRPEKNDKKKRK